MGAPYVPRATVGATAAPETWHPAGGSRRKRQDGDAGTGTMGPAAPPNPRRRGGVPDPPSGGTRAPAGAGLARPGGRGRRRLTWRQQARAARCAWDDYSLSSCKYRPGGPDMHGGNYWRWLVTRDNSHEGKLGLGDSFRPFRTKGDDGERHRRRRQVNRVFMSYRFDRSDFPDLESLSGCRVSGPDGRYFPPTEVTPLKLVQQRWCAATAARIFAERQPPQMSLGSGALAVVFFAAARRPPHCLLPGDCHLFW